jgi:hypothetical protein
MAKQIAKKPVVTGCVYYEGHPQFALAGACNKPGVVEGPHGWLCKDHRPIYDAQMNAQRVSKQNKPLDDASIIENIIASEKKLIANGVIRSVRFGAIQPDYVRYWELQA